MGEAHAWELLGDIGRCLGLGDPVVRDLRGLRDLLDLVEVHDGSRQGRVHSREEVEVAVRGRQEVLGVQVLRDMGGRRLEEGEMVSLACQRWAS